jgi:hypothetical protein
LHKVKKKNKKLKALESTGEKFLEPIISTPYVEIAYQHVASSSEIAHQCVFEDQRVEQGWTWAAQYQKKPYPLDL